jgi:hypothetical protein
MTIRIELDSVRKYRNAHEWRPVNRASAQGIEEVGDHEIISALCRKLIAAGHSGQVEVWRGETPCFRAIDIETWANKRVGKGEQPEHLRRAAE